MTERTRPSRTSSLSRRLTTRCIISSTRHKSTRRSNATSSSTAVIYSNLTSIDRYERNNFFVAADSSVLSSNQRLFNIESPYTHYVRDFSGARMSTQSNSRPRTAQSNRSHKPSRATASSGFNTLDAAAHLYNPQIVNSSGYEVPIQYPPQQADTRPRSAGKFA